jgi:hypothetical protein
VVERIDSNRDASLSSDMVALVVDFKTQGGRMVRVRRLVPTGEGYVYEAGDQIPVAYLERVPERAEFRIWQANWIGGAIVALFGVAMASARLAA